MLLFDLFSKAQNRTGAQIEGENCVWFEYLLLSLFVHYDDVNLLVDTRYQAALLSCNNTLPRGGMYSFQSGSVFEITPQIAGQY